jgi:class 3 adenylate cyclase
MSLQALEPRVVKGVARPVPVWQVPREIGFLDRTPSEPRDE